MDLNAFQFTSRVPETPENEQPRSVRPLALVVRLCTLLTSLACPTADSEPGQTATMAAHIMGLWVDYCFSRLGVLPACALLGCHLDIVGGWASFQAA
jgi:hypothetical protein